MFDRFDGFDWFTTQVPGPRSQIPDPRSPIPYAGAQITDERSQIPVPVSQSPAPRIPDPRPHIPEPGSQITDHRSPIPYARSEIPVPIHQISDPISHPSRVSIRSLKRCNSRVNQRRPQPNQGSSYHRSRILTPFKPSKHYRTRGKTAFFLSVSFLRPMVFFYASATQKTL